RLRGVKFIRRSIRRFRRFLLFKLRWNLFRQPFSGQRDILEPLKKWGVPEEAPPTPQLYFQTSDLKSRFRFERFVALAPSAAYPLKRWPLEYWKQLIRLLPESNFVVLGGNEDLFLNELESVDKNRVQNMAGLLSLT